MQKKRHFLGAIICAIVLIALTVVPMFAVNASAATDELALEITKADFNSTSYAANNNTKTEGAYSYTSYQVMNQQSVMQWQKSKGYITLTNSFTKMEIKVTSGTFTVTVGGTTITGTTASGVTTYDLSGKSGTIKIAVGGATGKVDYIKFYVAAGAASCEHTETTETVTKEPNCTEAGSKTTSCNNCDWEQIDAIPALGHTYENDVCSVCGNVKEHWVLKDISEITANDKVVITMSKGGKTFAMSNDNGTSSAPTAVPVAILDGELDSEVADAWVWNISNNNGNIVIYPDNTTSKWLYCTNANNGIRVGTESAKNFVIDAAGGYLKHTGTGRYLGVYSESDWRCYTGYTGTSNIAGQTLAFYVYDDPNAPDITGAQVNVGADLAIKYHAFIPAGMNVSEFSLRITSGHGTVSVITDCVAAADKENTYIFTYAGIAPQCMSDNIKAELLCGDEVVDIVAEYSVVQNAKNLAAAEGATAELKQVLADLLAYGKAAQEYLGDKHTVSAVTDADIAAIGATPSAKAPEAGVLDSNRVLNDPTKPESAYISGAGVRFGNQVQIYVTVKGANAADAKVKVNGTFYDVVASGDKYIVYLPGVSITQISSPVSIELYVGDEMVHTITYGAYAYVYQMISKDDTSAMAALAKALYNCAESAMVYITANA